MKLKLGKLKVHWEHYPPEKDDVVPRSPKIALENDEPTFGTDCHVHFNGNIVITSAYLSYKDKFSKKTGRHVSLRKALDFLQLGKKQRTKVWEDLLVYEEMLGN